MVEGKNALDGHITCFASQCSVHAQGDVDADPPGVLDRLRRLFVVQLFELFKYGQYFTHNFTDFPSSCRAAIKQVAPGVARKMTSCEDVFFNRPCRIFAVRRALNVIHFLTVLFIILFCLVRAFTGFSSWAGIFCLP